MATQSILSKAVLAGVVAAAAAASFSGAVLAADKEKCYGVVKAQKNDCANASGAHSCAGQASEDASGGDWVYVPAGLCQKLAGGSTEPK